MQKKEYRTTQPDWALVLDPAGELTDDWDTLPEPGPEHVIGQWNKKVGFVPGHWEPGLGFIEHAQPVSPTPEMEALFERKESNMAWEADEQITSAIEFGVLDIGPTTVRDLRLRRQVDALESKIEDMTYLIAELQELKAQPSLTPRKVAEEILLLIDKEVPGPDEPAGKLTRLAMVQRLGSLERKLDGQYPIILQFLAEIHDAVTNREQMLDE